MMESTTDKSGETGSKLMDVRFKDTSKIETIFDIMKVYGGVGGFMAYEYATDFTYSKRYSESPKVDKYTWLNLGPGAVRGLNRLLHGKPLKTKPPYALDLCLDILKRWKEWTYAKGVNLPEKSKCPILYSAVTYTYKHLDMRTVEHWLCEFDKYERGGSSKRNYDGGT